MSRKSIKKGPNKGIKYEERINLILKEKNLQLQQTQSAGASDLPDGYFWYDGERYPLEIKKPVGDFAQVELRWTEDKRFFYSPKSKNLDFIDFLSDQTNFLEKINSKWVDIPRKFSQTELNEEDRYWDLDHFPDIKENIKVSYIEKFYNLKTPSVYYIQIEGRGFFYMGKDILNLGVPKLNGRPYLRARVKTRSSSRNKWGFLVAIKMPYIKESEYDLEENTNKKFPIPEGDHVKGPMNGYL
ncbi:MAG: hypothetical protein GF311_17475 [Candidatus Lokiarchaeota archaeon]|nr:hypothetical protein [Candidatus Lokiarchaeota archaeon]